MAAPRVFISSTCYDLKYIRENLKFFIKSLGYEPILSEAGSVFYDPTLHVQDACLAEIPSCQMFILIIGGRYGSVYKSSDKSITNHEFKEAAKNKTPVFAMVEQGVYDQYQVYQDNKNNSDIDASKIHYPSVDSTKIFDFVSEVQSQSLNNALVPFSDFEGIQSYLKQQWASMFHHHLTSETETKRVTDFLREISSTNEKIEFLSRQVLSSVGDSVAQLRVKAYDYLIDDHVAHNLSNWGIKPTPDIFLKYTTLDELCDNQIVAGDERDEKYTSSTFTYGGPPYEAGSTEIKKMRAGFLEIKEELGRMLYDAGVSVEEFINTSNNAITEK